MNKNQLEKKFRLRPSQKRYRQRIIEHVKDAIANEEKESDSWVPRRAQPILLEDDISLSTRWECERFCREHTAWASVLDGVNIRKTNLEVTMTCRKKIREGKQKDKKVKKTGCPCFIHFFRCPGTGRWVPKKAVEHSEECVVQ